VTANIHEPEWDAETDREPYRWRRSLIGRRAGSERLGASLYDVAPGGATFPFHAHHANEELLIVVRGTPSLRTPAGERVLAQGEVVAFRVGSEGAHAVTNRTADTVRIMIVSTMVAPDMNEFPDSGTLWARSFAPGSVPPDDAVAAVGRVGDTIDPLAGGI
jgi:uncharacterized cupin superfamily protein